MADQADVRSLEQLEQFQLQLHAARSKMVKLVEDLQLELRRLTDWIEGEATTYWQQQLVQAQRNLVEAQEALSRCMSYVRVEERRPCTEQKKRVQVCRTRRQLCEEQVQTARSAAKAWERQMRKSQTKIQRCRDLSESDLAVAYHHLKDQIERLQQYAQIRRSPARRSETARPGEAGTDVAGSGDAGTNVGVASNREISGDPSKKE